MRSSVPSLSASIVLMTPDNLPLKRPTTLLLQKNHPHPYNYWALHDRLRLQNEKLVKRQQSSCRITLYSLWLFIFSIVTSIVIYRFTDECLETTVGKILFAECLRYWLLLGTISISSLACCGVIVGVYKYLRSRPRTFRYEDEYQQFSKNKNTLLPMTTVSRSSHYSTSFSDESPLASCRKYMKHNHRSSNMTEISASTNTSSQRKELKTISDCNISSKSSNMMNNKNLFLLLPRSSLQSYFSTETSSNDTHSKKNKSVSLSENNRLNTLPVSQTTYLSGVDIWEKQQKTSLSSFH
ncbi:hypothetical protein I4U23_000322 [Adineta vaga]|nr:hypothetical protein I4U23_000322 [Adineta vaga]